MKKIIFNRALCLVPSKISLKMRLTTLLLIVSLLKIQANTYSQNTKITLNLEHVTVLDVLEAIESKTEFNFFYNSTDFDLSRRVTAKVNKESINYILDELFKNRKILHDVTDKQIVLYPNPNPIVSSTLSKAEKVEVKEIKGEVTDTQGTPLPAVSVVIVGTQKGTETDFDGNFTIDANEGDVLEFSYIGMKTVRVTVGTDSYIRVQLQDDAASLDEVVVVGYGQQKKVNLTGAVGVVTSKEIENKPVTNISSALQGIVPGVTIIQNSGQPGKDGAQIRIRGIGSLNSSVSPMVLVDGIQSSMNDIDPNDIASISILKDAASAAIYGVRAANGVVLITTKKGGDRPLKLSYNSYLGWQKTTREPEKFSSAEYAELYNEALVNSGKPALWSVSDITKFRDGSDLDNFPNTNWRDLLYTESGVQQQHHLNINGGNEISQYSFSLGYFNQEGLIKNTAKKRYNLRANFNHKLSEKLDVGMNLSYSLTNTIEPTNPFSEELGQIIRQVNRIAPWVPYKYSDGSYGYIGDGNPIAWLDNGGTSDAKKLRNTIIVHGDYKLLKGLKARGVLSYRTLSDVDEAFTKNIQFYDFISKEPSFTQGPNMQNDYRANASTLVLRYLLMYEKEKNDHHIKILAGYEQESYRLDFTRAIRKDFLNNELTEINAGSTEGQVGEGSGEELALESYFGRINYGYKDRYLLEANLRRDGSSRFTEENRWGVFPAVSAGWRVSEEDFMQEIDYVSNLKLRASWGLLGNQQTTGYYPSISSVSLGQDYNFGGSIASGASVTTPGNRDIQWEATETYDIGLDLAMFNNRLTFSTDYFKKTTTDILLDLPVSGIFGLDAPIQNAGTVENKGFEFQVGFKGQMDEFKYNISSNLSFIDTEIIDLKGIDPVVRSGGRTVWEVGLPINTFYGYESMGIFNTNEEVVSHATQRSGTGPGDIRYRDQNNDGKINGDDRVGIGSWDPGITYSTNISLNYKVFDFSMFLQGVGDVKGYVWGEALGRMEGYTSNPLTIHKDRWTPNNHSNKFPRLLTSSYIQNDPGSTPSDFWIQDASYLRLKNLQIGYNIPTSFLKTLNISKFRFYYSGQNLLTFTNFLDGFDPEAPAGTRGSYYPQVKTHSLGINVIF